MNRAVLRHPRRALTELRASRDRLQVVAALERNEPRWTEHDTVWLWTTLTGDRFDVAIDTLIDLECVEVDGRTLKVPGKPARTVFYYRLTREYAAALNLVRGGS